MYHHILPLSSSGSSYGLTNRREPVSVLWIPRTHKAVSDRPTMDPVGAQRSALLVLRNTSQEGLHADVRWPRQDPIERRKAVMIVTKYSHKVDYKRGADSTLQDQNLSHHQSHKTLKHILTQSNSIHTYPVSKTLYLHNPQNQNAILQARPCRPRQHLCCERHAHIRHERRPCRGEEVARNRGTLVNLKEKPLVAKYKFLGYFSDGCCEQRCNGTSCFYRLQNIKCTKGSSVSGPLSR